MEKQLKEENTITSEKYEYVCVKVGMWNEENCLLTSFENLNYITMTLIKVSKNKFIQTFFLV